MLVWLGLYTPNGEYSAHIVVFRVLGNSKLRAIGLERRTRVRKRTRPIGSTVVVEAARPIARIVAHTNHESREDGFRQDVPFINDLQGVGIIQSLNGSHRRFEVIHVDVNLTLRPALHIIIARFFGKPFIERIRVRPEDLLIANIGIRIIHNATGKRTVSNLRLIIGFELRIEAIHRLICRRRAVVTVVIERTVCISAEELVFEFF